MPSSTRRGLIDAAETWNRRLHYYSGLYLLFFLWLFAFTGLLLNHPKWSFAEFWTNRQQSRYELPIAAPAATGDVAQAEEILRQAGIRGEIEWTKARADEGVLEFRASRPGHIYEIRADLRGGRATVQRIELNAWGVTRILHTFTGVRLNDQRNARDWWATRLWAFSMDAVAAGLIFMVLSSVWLWWSQKRKRAAGLAALLAGTALCGLFVMGLRWLV